MIMENDRLMLRRLEDKDLNGLIRLRDDLCVYRYEPAFLIELQGTPAEALKIIQETDLWKDRQCILGIFEKNNPDILTGFAEFYDFKPSGKVISIEYRLMSEYWGRGIASDCISILLDYLRNHTEVELVTAHVIPDNKSSAHCLIKNGFQYLLTKTEDWGHDHPDVADVYTFDC